MSHETPKAVEPSAQGENAPPAPESAQNSPQSTMTWDQFFVQEAISRATLVVKRPFVDMAGSVTGGLMLTYIVYWHIPDEEGNPRLKVERDGHLWLVAPYRRWEERCCIPERTARRKLKELVDMKLVEVNIWKIQSIPTVHLRLTEHFLSEYVKCVSANWPDGFGQNGQMRTAKMAESSIRDLNIEDRKDTKSHSATRAGGRIPFTVPLFDEVVEKFKDLKAPDPERMAEDFFDHYTQVDWKIGGKVKMRSWEIAAGNWLRRSKEWGSRRREEDGKTSQDRERERFLAKARQGG